MLGAVEGKPLGRRETRKRRTRRALVDAAYALFATAGYHATTMDDVADAAGVSRRTAFRYFPTKHSLVFSERDRRLARFGELLWGEPAREPYEAVRHAVLALAGEYEDERGYLLTQSELVRATPELAGLELRLDQAFEEAMVARMQNGMRAGVTDRRARVLAAAVMGVTRASLREWLESRCEGDLQRLGEEAFRVLEEGVRGR